jgi:Glycosyltransferase family 43.
VLYVVFEFLHLLYVVYEGIPFTHIASPMPVVYRKANITPRGVANRRAAIQWIRKNAQKGVVYFGDDDNTFDLKLFEEIRDTKKVSMFPVGLIGDYAVSSPVLKEVKYLQYLIYRKC